MSRYLLNLSGMLLVVLACAGCEEDIVLVSGTERAFSLYGVLNPTADTQFVFVFPVEGRLDPAASEALDVKVTSTDLTGGGATVWKDSLVTNDLGLYGHAFWTTERVAYGHRYRVEAEGPDGSRSAAEVTAPPRVTWQVGAPSMRDPIGETVFVTGAPRLLKPQVTFMAATARNWGPTGIEYAYTDVTVPYDDVMKQTADGWKVPVDLGRAYHLLFNKLAGIVEDHIEHYGVDLWMVTFEAIVASEEWNPPGGIFDPDALVHPEVMTNVEDGFGFVGAGYRIRHRWTPTPEVVVQAKFNPD